MLRCVLCGKTSGSGICRTAGCAGGFVRSGGLGERDDDDDDDDDDRDDDDDDRGGAVADVVSLADVDAREMQRLPTGSAAWDAVLSGGLVRGAVLLVGGTGGAGKSSDAVAMVAHARGVFASWEMNAATLLHTARRVGAAPSRVRAVFEPDVRALIAATPRERLIVVDSLAYAAVDGRETGSDAAQAAALSALERHASSSGAAIVVIVHGTKNEDFSGRAWLLHHAAGLVWVTPDALAVRHKWRFGPPLTVDRATGSVTGGEAPTRRRASRAGSKRDTGPTPPLGVPENAPPRPIRRKMH